MASTVVPKTTIFDFSLVASDLAEIAALSNGDIAFI